MNFDLGAFAGIHLKGENASRLLARLVGRPALSVVLAGMSLPRPRFALDIPPKRTISPAQLRFQG